MAPPESTTAALLDDSALRDPLRSFDRTPWVTPGMAARAFARSEQTIRTWMRNDLVRTKRLDDGTVVVFWPDVSKQSDTRPRRLRIRRSQA